MDISRRQTLQIAAGAAAFFIAPRTACAQDFPVRPIRLVIPYPPGGVVDATGRPWAEKMKTLLGTVVVENIGGGGGAMGASAVARAPADGYTVLLGNSSVMVINPLAGSHTSYDPVKSFDMVSIVGHVTQAFAVHPSLPVPSLRELADYAKRNPGKLSYGTPGLGSLNHLTGELFKLHIEAPDIVHVPYRGAGPAVADVVGGQVPMAIPAVNGHLLALHRAGRLRLLAVTSPHPLSAAPDIPTVVQAGMPQLVVQGANWLCVPRGSPAAAIARISQATGSALTDPDLQRIYVASGIEPSADASPDAAARFLQSEIARWGPIVKRIGLHVG